jgi:hypothetical protein
MGEVKTILNKKYGIPLVQKGFKVIDIQPSNNKGNGDIAFIFEKTDELEREFSIMINESRFSKQLHGLTLYDIRTLQGVLSGYEVSDEDRFRIMRILTDIDYDIIGYKEPEEEIINLPEEILETVSEDPVEVNTNELIQAMSGNKNYKKYDAAYNKVVKKR